MADLLIHAPEKILASLRERAEQEHTTVEALAEQILSEPFLEVDPEIDYPEWLKPALFHGGTEVTGSNAEEILHSNDNYEEWHRIGLFDSGPNDTGRQADDILLQEWNPDPRD